MSDLAITQGKRAAGASGFTPVRRAMRKTVGLSHTQTGKAGKK
jgi:hypothetical protein